MIQILVVEDQNYKQDNIKQIILDNSNIKPEDLHIVGSIKDAKRLLYENYYDLMILDLVLPIEIGGEALPINGAQFLEDIHSSPMIKPPIQIIGLSGYSEYVTKYHDQFKMKLWHLIDYQADSTSWQEQLKSIIYHLVKTRERFIQTSVRKDLFDIAIITALPKPELEAVLRLGGGNWERVVVENDVTQYFKKTFTDGVKTRNIIAATADQMGMTASSHLATKIILYFKPKYIIMAGIAAGIKDRGLGFGDILIAEQSWDYGSGKIVETRTVKENEIPDVTFETDLRPIQLSAELKSKISSFQLSHSSILDRVQNDWPGEPTSTKLKSHLGPIATGSYVISSSSTLDEVKEQQRKLLGIEMETYGLYYASEHSPEPKTKAISIKSVTDYGDGEKNDKYQKYAAYTSASFIYHFIMKEL